MTMLNGTLRLHDIADVEAAANRIAEDFLRPRRAYLREHDRADLIAFLIETAYRLSLRYDPNRGWSFSKLFYDIGTKRVADFYRARWHDTRSPKPELALSLDAPAVNADTTDGPGPSLVETLATQTAPGDLATDMDSDRLVGWLRHHRDRGQTPPDPWLGRPTRHGTPDAAQAA